jgi:hypothetical protein
MEIIIVLIIVIAILSMAGSSKRKSKAYSRLYDPSDNSYVNGPAASGFAGGILTPHGKVILVPNTAANIGIYDPVADSFVLGPAATGFNGCVFGPEGKVFFIPHNSQALGIYHPVANSFTLGQEHGRGPQAFVGGAVASCTSGASGHRWPCDSKVILAPYQSTHIGVIENAGLRMGLGGYFMHTWPERIKRVKS